MANVVVTVVAVVAVVAAVAVAPCGAGVDVVAAFAVSANQELLPAANYVSFRRRQ